MKNTTCHTVGTVPRSNRLYKINTSINPNYPLWYLQIIRKEQTAYITKISQVTEDIYRALIM